MKTIKIKYFILVLILFQSILTLAQEPMVAYRKEGIWHYFDTNGKLMWKPYLDVAGFPSGWVNGLLRAAVMNVKGDNADNIGLERKQVLYDKKGNIVFQPNTKLNYMIVSGFDKAGYILLRDMDEERIVLCDKTGNIVYESPHTYSQYLGDGVVAYIKDGIHTDGDKIYVLYDIKTKKTLAEVNCIAFLGNYRHGVIFSFNEKARYGMYDRTGKELQPMIWDSDLLAMDEDSIMMTGFVCLKNPKTEKYHLFNKNGEDVLSKITESIALKNGFFTGLIEIEEGDHSLSSYALLNNQIKKIDEKYGSGTEITEGGVIACKNDEETVTLIDKNLKNLATIKDVKEVRALNHHFWIQSDKDGIFDCYDEKGKKVGAIQAEAIGIPAYNHVPFMQNGKWGLAHETGKVVIQPQFDFNDQEIPKVENGYWGINVTLPDNNHRFDFYNFQGKLVMSSTSEKDGWDYLLQQETAAYFYKMY